MEVEKILVKSSGRLRLEVEGIQKLIILIKSLKTKHNMRRQRKVKA